MPADLIVRAGPALAGCAIPAHASRTTRPAGLTASGRSSLRRPTRAARAARRISHTKRAAGRFDSDVPRVAALCLPGVTRGRAARAAHRLFLNPAASPE